MKPLLSLLLMSVVLLMGSCLKWGELPDEIDGEITGKLTIWESDKPFVFDPSQPPTVMLMEQRYHTAWTPYLVPLKKVLVNARGEFRIDYRLLKEKEYFLEAAGYEKPKYMEMAPPQKVNYQKKQSLDVPVVARSWAIPRFVNIHGFQSDTFYYNSGFGSSLSLFPLVGKVDTVISWVYATWGGATIGSSKHYVNARIVRNNTTYDTLISYFVPPGDTSVITIAY